MLEKEEKLGLGKEFRRREVWLEGVKGGERKDWKVTNVEKKGLGLNKGVSMDREGVWKIKNWTHERREIGTE